MELRDLIIDKIETSQTELANKIGVSRQIINAIINGSYKNKPNIITVKKICKFFNVDFRDYYNK